MSENLSVNSLLKAFAEADEQFTALQCLRQQLEQSRYGDENLLDEGGAKKIYLSQDLVSGRRLARAFPKSPELQEDFLREARLHSRLEHPNIIPLYDIGLEDGQPFFSMKYIQGQNLEQYINENKDHLHENAFRNEMLDIFLKVCDAVAYAHAQNILHLDLKPANIQRSDYGEVLVGDWGLARVQGREIPEGIYNNFDCTGNFTRYGYLNGTPGFMAPEQCVKGLEKGPQADVYALGAVLVYLFCGEAPITGTMENITVATKKGLWSFDLNKVPLGLQQVVKKALATKLENRYTSVKELREDINAYRSGYLTSADDHSTRHLLHSLYKRNRAFFLAGSGFLSVIIILTTLFINRLKISQRYAQNSEEESLESLDKIRRAQEEKQKLDREFAGNYLEGAISYYKNRTRGVHNYYTEYDEKAYQLVSRALELDDTDHEAWVLKGRLAMLTSRLEAAEFSFEKAGEEYEIHRKTALENKYKDLQDVHVILPMLKQLLLGKDPRLVHDFIFKTIFSKITMVDRLYFIEEALKLRNPVVKDKPFKFVFDNKKMSLDLSGNTSLKYIFMLKNLPLREINFSNTDIAGDFSHVNTMPLVKVNVANTGMDDKMLRYLKGRPIRELNLQNCAVSSLRCLRDMPLEVLDIRGTQIEDYSMLNHMPYLRQLICEQQQYAEIVKVLGSRKKIIDVK